MQANAAPTGASGGANAGAGTGGCCWWQAVSVTFAHACPFSQQQLSESENC